MDTDAALLTTSIPHDVSGWWVSEKFDGVRAIWTGSALLTRHGKRIKAPDWFIAGMPTGVRLDGELWMGRGSFDKLQSVLQKKGSDWSEIRFMVFDLAGPGTFEERYEELQDLDLPSYCHCVSHMTLPCNEALDGMEAHIVNDLGGEGCVIRRPGCLYCPGRSGDVIKVKRLVADIDRWQG